MKFILSLKVLSLLPASVLAFPNIPAWSPPGPNDRRGPCPALNTLANHNLIPHSGINITVPQFVSGITTGLNISAEIAMSFALAGVALVSPDPASGTFSLSDLDKHNAIEHDASLSRSDYYRARGDDHTFQQAIFQTVLNHFNGSDVVNASAMAVAHLDRVQNERSRDPQFTYNTGVATSGYLEAALFMLTMVEAGGSDTLVRFVEVFFEQERLPIEEGWIPPVTQITGLTLTQAALAVALAAGEKVNATGDFFARDAIHALSFP